MKKKLVSVVLPTYNCEDIVAECLQSVAKQTYPPLEIIIVDAFSSDTTARIAKTYGRVYSFGRDPSQKNIFAAAYQRNYGVSKAHGDYIYLIDSDMRLPPHLISSCVNALEIHHADAVIIPEVSYGEGFWAACRRLEKSCYNSSAMSYTDAARFVKRSVWERLGGLDVTLGGGDDWDFQLRLRQAGYRTVKTRANVKHYEGKLTLGKQLYKKFRYGKTVLAYFRKHRNKKTFLLKQYSLIRPDFVSQWKILCRDPLHAFGMIFMKTAEYAAAFLGIIVSQIKKEDVRIRR